MKYSELMKVLRRAGCYEKDRKGRHPKWYSPITGKDFYLSHHEKEEVPRGTLGGILRDAGVKL
ncbi:MAG: type II toxin-antitoxin system HicA family toxin [Lachnospiraceae bacterium]|nr:type II toxin-antitoxin system HicA family toxin [Lachnospiraceae bacterium]MBO5407448.1 type II toxin-antitoxin system HicA family toxin [Bacteroidales bacterium]